MSLEENPHITIVAPDSHSSVPIFIQRPNLNDHPYLSPDGSPTGLDSGSSGGFSLPNTPNLDLNFINTNFTNSAEDYDLSVLSAPMHSPYSPSGATSLSPHFGGLSLGADAVGQGNDVFGHHNSIYNQYDDKNLALGVSDFSLVHNEAVSSSSSRALSPLMIPQPHLDAQGQDSWNPGQVDDFDFLSLYHDSSPSLHPIDPLPPHHSPFLSQRDTLPHEPSLQRISGRVNAHMRGTSEMGTPWTASSHSSNGSLVTSPSLVLTPSEPSNSAGAYDNSLNVTYTDLFSAGATVSRRHSHSGARGLSVGPDRGRTEGRSPIGSPNSSRRSSPYPNNRPNASPVAQAYEDNLLAVPGLEEGLRRRHSFTYGGHHSLPTAASPAALSGGSVMGYSEAPPTPTGTRKIASQAGLKASEARRTKEAKFQCDLCDQTFTTNHNLKNHRNVHLGVKEHGCPHCTRAFTTQSVLARHLKTCKAAGVPPLNDTRHHRRQPSCSS
ncbi:hypothetical protein FA15DRAFT_701324 [Coprinopsis marcescibilis]|uniref:C2H2-type domain-containing protein n=1 Tax=Coprinopsis marcescibilis TaxID=230819 RepID=A0A5C3L6N6_COPMA|nr:hypothetical protein FA15DRAFT_701324 [Coprinopsis marcescibilis]